MRFHAVQQKGQGDDGRELIERCITFELSVDYDFLLTCTSLIGIQARIFYYRLKSIIELSPRHTEESRKFSLCHGYVSISFSDNLYIPAPIKVTAMIGSVCYCFCVIFCFYAVSSILQVDISKSSQASLSVVPLFITDCMAMSLSISSEIFLSVTCA